MKKKHTSTQENVEGNFSSPCGVRNEGRMTYERVTVQNDQTNNSVYKSVHFIQTNEDNSVIVCLFVRQTLNPSRTTETLPTVGIVCSQ